MLRATVLLGLLSTTAFAADPLHAIIFAGGATPADAQAALAAYKSKLERHLEEVVKLPAGEPRIVESAKLPGLKPGFHVVTLGLCKAPEPVLAAIKAFYPGAYARPLTGDAGPERCPTLVEDAQVTALDATVKVPAQPDVNHGPQVLTAFLTTTLTKDERGRALDPSFVGFVLVERATGLVHDVLTLEGASADRVGDGPAGWEYETCKPTVTPDKNGFTLTRTCTSEQTGCAANVKAIEKEWKDVTKVTVVGDLLAAGEAKKTVLSRSKCGRGGSGD